MNEIGRINLKTENKNKGLLFGFLFSLLFIAGLYFPFPFSLQIAFLKLNFLDILFFPLMVVGTTIIHELIHILFFKTFSRGKAKLRVKRERSFGAIVIQEQNPDVSYSKSQTLITLTAPFFLITCLSILLFFAFKNQLLILFLNCVMNGIGSSIDFYLSFKLVFKYPHKIRISYNSGQEIGMILYKNK